MHKLFATILCCLPLVTKAAAIHGIASHGPLKYPPSFKHFDYINPSAPKGGSIRFEAIGNFDQLNPFILKGTPARNIDLIYDTLLTSSRDEPSSVYGLLAESIDIQEENHSIHFYLRKNAYFHDRTPITSQDVVFTYHTLMEKGSPQYALSFSDIEKVTAPSDTEVIFYTQSKPTREMAMTLGFLPILPKHFWSKHDFVKEAHLTPLGSGPYRIKKVNFGSSIEYERVNDYWGIHHPVNVGRNNFDQIKYIYFLDPSIALESFLAQDIDFRQEYNSKDWATRYQTASVKNKDIILYSPHHQLPQGMQGFVFNLRKQKFQDIRVRKALSLALNFEWCNKELFYGQYQRSESFFNNSFLKSTGSPSNEELKYLEPYRSTLPNELFQKSFKAYHTNGSWYGIRSNLIQAASLLEEAGYEIKDNVLVNKKTQEPFTFTMLLISPGFKRIVLPYFKNLERLGIQANAKLIDVAQYIERVENFDYEMIVSSFPQSPSPGLEQINYWHSQSAHKKGSSNYIGIEDPLIDRIVMDITQTHSMEKLKTLTSALDRILLWNHYLVPHWYLDHYRIAYVKKLKHPETPPYGLDIMSWWSEKTSSKQESSANL